MSDEYEPEGTRAEPRLVPAEETAKGRGVRFLVIGGALAALGVFAGFVWYAYNQSAQTGLVEQPLTILADKGPTKVKPDTPGGMDVPHQDKAVYNRMVSGARDKDPKGLVPVPEKPIKKPLQPDAALLEDLFGDKAPPPPAIPKTADDKSPVIVDLLPAKSTKPAASQSGAAKKATATTLDMTSSKFLVQIGAFRDRSGADSAWARLRKKHGGLLAGLEPDIMRADLGAKGVFYRLRAGPLNDKGSADSLCVRMKAAKIGCLVIKP